MSIKDVRERSHWHLINISTVYGDDDDLMSPRELTIYLDLKAHDLQKWRDIGVGPTYLTLPNERVKYRRADVRLWLHQLLEEQDARTMARRIKLGRKNAYAQPMTKKQVFRSQRMKDPCAPKRPKKVPGATGDALVDWNLSAENVQMETSKTDRQIREMQKYFNELTGYPQPKST